MVRTGWKRLPTAGVYFRGCIQVIAEDGEDRVEEEADSWSLFSRLYPGECRGW